MDQKFIEKYNPFNAKQLSEADIAAMENFSLQELEALAKAYPNPGRQKTYLIIKDKNKDAKNQLFPVSTWWNLWQLHKIGQKHFVAFTFSELFNANVRERKIPVGEVQDLTEKEVHEGLKIGGEQKVAEKDTADLKIGAEQSLNEKEEDKGTQGEFQSMDEDFEDDISEAEKKAAAKVQKQAKPIKPNKAKK